MSENHILNTIANRLLTAHDNIAQACINSGRNRQSVTLMAVSKTKPDEAIMAAYEAGQRIFGENYAQELADKAERLQQLEQIEWHYIGPIQSNKTKMIAKVSHWVDSVDREKIALRLDQHAKEFDKTLNVLIQVNVSRSKQKSGVLIEDVANLAAKINALPNIELRGLMAIPDKYDSEAQTRQEFIAMNTCFLKLKQQYPQVDTLSLGMSGDMKIAIESGSTMIRLGTAIFGEREAK